VLKRSVSLVIEAPAGLLLVRRPDDDESLPGAWGLPAASLLAGESERDAVVRAGREKLGVELEVVGVLAEERAQRPGYEIAMRDWAVRIAVGEPAVPQPGEGTQYVEWRWGRAEDLAPAARAGSLCARALLRERGLGSTW
jgi:ADP-ribose pyrophosphatase YjhB (NUDIX family)